MGRITDAQNELLAAALTVCVLLWSRYDGEDPDRGADPEECRSAPAHRSGLREGHGTGIYMNLLDVNERMTGADQAEFEAGGVRLMCRPLPPQTLINDLEGDTHGDFEDLLVALVTPPAAFDCQEVIRAIKVRRNRRRNSSVRKKLPDSVFNDCVWDRVQGPRRAR